MSELKQQFVIDLEKANKRKHPWVASVEALADQTEDKTPERETRYYSGVKGREKSDIGHLGRHIDKLVRGSRKLGDLDWSGGRQYNLTVNTDYSDPEHNPLAELHEGYGKDKSKTVKRLEGEPAKSYEQRLLAEYVNRTHGTQYEPAHFAAGEQDRKPGELEPKPVAGAQHKSPEHKALFDAMLKQASASRKDSEANTRGLKNFKTELPKLNPGTDSEVDPHTHPASYLIQSGAWPYKKKAHDGRMLNDFTSPQAKYASHALFEEIKPNLISAVGKIHEGLKTSPDTLRSLESSGYVTNPAKLRQMLGGKGSSLHRNVEFPDSFMDAWLGAQRMAEDWGQNPERDDRHFRTAVSGGLGENMLGRLTERLAREKAARETEGASDEGGGGKASTLEALADANDAQHGNPIKDKVSPAPYTSPDVTAETRQGFQLLKDRLGVNQHDPKSVLPYLALLSRERMLEDTHYGMKPGGQKEAPSYTTGGAAPSQWPEVPGRDEQRAALLQQHSQLVGEHTAAQGEFEASPAYAAAKKTQDEAGKAITPLSQTHTQAANALVAAQAAFGKAPTAENQTAVLAAQDAHKPAKEAYRNAVEAHEKAQAAVGRIKKPEEITALEAKIKALENKITPLQHGNNEGVQRYGDRVTPGPAATVATPPVPTTLKPYEDEHATPEAEKAAEYRGRDTKVGDTSKVQALYENPAIRESAIRRIHDQHALTALQKIIAAKHGEHKEGVKAQVQRDQVMKLRATAEKQGNKAALAGIDPILSALNEKAAYADKIGTSNPDTSLDYVDRIRGSTKDKILSDAVAEFHEKYPHETARDSKGGRAG